MDISKVSSDGRFYPRYASMRALKQLSKSLPEGSREWVVVMAEIHSRQWRLQFGDYVAEQMRLDLLRLWSNSHSIDIDFLLAGEFNLPAGF